LSKACGLRTCLVACLVPTGPPSVSARLSPLPAVSGLRSAGARQRSMRARPQIAYTTASGSPPASSCGVDWRRAAQVLLASFRVYSGLNRKYISEQLTSSAEASTVAEETFGSIRTVTRGPLCRAADMSPPGPARLLSTLLRWGTLAGDTPQACVHVAQPQRRRSNGAGHPLALTALGRGAVLTSGVLHAGALVCKGERVVRPVRRVADAGAALGPEVRACLWCAARPARALLPTQSAGWLVTRWGVDGTVTPWSCIQPPRRPAGALRSASPVFPHAAACFAPRRAGAVAFRLPAHGAMQG